MAHFTFAHSRPHARSIWLGALIVFVSLAVLALPSRPSPGAYAQENTDAGVAGAFARAAWHWNVPQPVLMAIGYVESHWWQRPGEPSIDNGFGIMHLVDGHDGTLEKAAKLTGLSTDSLKSDTTANIEGGAAVLSAISRKLKLAYQPRSDQLSSWFEAVAGYSGASDPTVSDGYAREVFRVLAEGATETLPSGEVLTLSPTAVGQLPLSPVPAPESEDYGPALWVQANANNYTVGRPYGSINWIVIHDTEGSYSSAINWFQNPNSGVSAHYVIRSSDGQITQMVREANTAYHAGVWDYNVRSIGIEHEGYMNQQGWYTEPMYQASSALARTVADRYGVRKDRAHIIGHYQVPNQSHTDPGPYWDWDHYMSLVRRDWAVSSVVDNTDPGFEAVPNIIDPAHYWHVYGNGYNGSSTYSTLSVADAGSSTNSGTWTTSLSSSGTYDVYAFIPWVDNNTPDTANAQYNVLASDGWHAAVVSQKGITDVGNGSWAHLGGFYFNGGDSVQVKLNDMTGEWGKNVWFDAVMWIPRGGGTPPPTTPPNPTRTVTPVRTATPHTTPTRTFTPAATWTPGPCGMRFVDLPDTYWAYSYISYLYCSGVISGYADGTFRPGATTTRGQLAKMITLGFGWQPYNPLTPDFSDVLPDNPYYQYIETCFLRGVINGYDDGTFRPGNPVTRAQVTKMLVLSKGWLPFSPAQPDFTDVAPDYWAYSYIEAAFNHAVVSGYSDGTFRPGVVVNRSQFSKMLTLTLQGYSAPGRPAATMRVPTPLK